MGAAPRSEHVRQTTPKQHINAFEKYDASVEGRRRVRAVDKDSADDGCVVGWYVVGKPSARLYIGAEYSFDSLFYKKVVVAFLIASVELRSWSFNV